MDGSRFDDVVRTIAQRPSRRAVLGALSGLAVSVVAGRHGEARARCRASGEVCRKDADCCAQSCTPPDRTGRRRCAAEEGSACGVGMIYLDGSCQGNGYCGPDVPPGSACGPSDVCSGTLEGTNCRATPEGGYTCMGNENAGTATPCTATSDCPDGYACRAQVEPLGSPICRPVCTVPYSDSSVSESALEGGRWCQRIKCRRGWHLARTTTRSVVAAAR